jgi:hypothetical protein
VRDDFGIEEIHAVKVALTKDQVLHFNLRPMMKAKQSSARYARFAEKYGDDVYELEALEPATLQQVVREAIESTIDVDLFNTEVQSEGKDAQFLAALRKKAVASLSTLVSEASA